LLAVQAWSERLAATRLKARNSRLKTTLRSCTLATCPVFLAVSLSPAIVQYAVVQSPGPSQDFDCDDSTMFTIHRLSGLGIQAKPLLGNLNVDGELYWQSDHIWVVVEVFGRWIAVDWGRLYFDKQHYQGYVVSHDELVAFVEQDRQNAGAEAALPAAP
jgi:hypothetical protein